MENDEDEFDTSREAPPRRDLDDVWRQLLDRIREESADAAAFLEKNATMRLEEENREVMIAGSWDAYSYLEKNPVIKDLVDRACHDVLGFTRAVWEDLGLREIPSPSGYAFFLSVWDPALEQLGGDEEDDAPEQQTASPFDAIKTPWADGTDRWSSRALADLFGYVRHDAMKRALEKTVESLKQSGHNPSDHMRHMTHMVDTGSGARREVKTYFLTRLACYLLAQNADPSKPAVALAQVYFATQARRQELSDQLRDDARRVKLRQTIVDHNVKLAEAARDSGVITHRDFAIFQNYGYMGLYKGLKAEDIKRRKGLAPKDSPLDGMGFDELAANYFRLSQTEQRLRREPVHSKELANQVHFDTGKRVRETIKELGGTMPEDLPAVDHIREAKKRIGNRKINEIDLFGEPAALDADDL